MKYNNFTYKMLLPLLAGLFLIGFVSISTNFFLLKKNISQKAAESFDFMSTSLDYIIKKDTDLMIGLIEQIEKDQKVVALFHSNKREDTYKYLLDTYKTFNKRYDITHFYIHKTTKQNFVRIHNQKKNSDFINRTTLENASKNLKPSSGVEFGISHNLTLRVVVPWFFEEKLIGYIELGKEVDKLTPELTSLVNVDMIFTIKKELISEKDFEKWKNSNNRNRHYEMMDNHYIIDSTVGKIGKELQEYFNERGVHDNHFIINFDRKFFVHTSPFYDVNNNHVGAIHLLIDETKDYTFLYNLIIEVTIIILCLLAFILVYYYKFLKKIEKKLDNAYEEIELISITDALTNLYNKRHYLENAPKQIRVSSRSNSYLSFILVDVDFFKNYNDNYGHLKGDEILQKVSLSIKNIYKRTSDCCYRVGGEEFLIISESEDKNNAYDMAELLCKAVEDLHIEHKYNESNIDHLTISVGVYTVKPDKTTKMTELYEYADKALYQSKNNGRNQVTML